MNPLKNSHLFRNMAIAVSSLLLVVMPGQPVLAQNQCATQSSLVNPVLAAASGIGGTGAPASKLSATNRRDLQLEAGSPPRSDSGGIGGTGIIAARPGIGGTGISDGGIGGTGIVGVITGFASICVNGEEVQFDANTPVTENGQPSSARQLAVGQVVAVRAAGVGAELSARTIALIHAVVGPVEAINRVTGEFSILGQKVQLLDPRKLSDLQTGTWVRVSGQRLAQGEIASSRIEPITPQAQVQLNGTVTRIDDNTITVEGTRVRVDAQQLPPDLIVGREVLVNGQWDGGAVLAQRVQSDPTRKSLGSVDHVVIEGYIHKLEGNQLNLGLDSMTLSATVQIVGGNSKQLTVNQRIQVSGRIAADRSIRIERVEFSHSSSGGSTSKTPDSDSSEGKGASSGKGASDSTEASGSSKNSDSSEGSGSSGSSRNSGSSEGSGSSGSSKNSGSSESSGSSGGSGKSGSSGGSGKSGSGGGK